MQLASYLAITNVNCMHVSKLLLYYAPVPTECTKILLNKVLGWIGYENLIDIIDALFALYKVLSESCPTFGKVVTKAVEEGIEQGIKFLKTVKNEVVKICKEHKDLTTQLSKLAIKACLKQGIASCGTKAAIKFGAGKVASQGSYTYL